MRAAIQREVFIEAPLESVWRVLTEPEEIARWFAPDVDLRPEPGANGTLTFRPEAGEPVCHHVSVTAMEPPRQFAYRWMHPAGVRAAPGNSTRVSFTLTPESGGTRVRVVEDELDEMGWPPGQHEAFVEQHRHGWALYLAALRNLLVQERQRGRVQ